MVGVKNVTTDERYFIAGPGGHPVLPALQESRCNTREDEQEQHDQSDSNEPPEAQAEEVVERHRLPEDTVLLEGIVHRLRRKVGTLRGIARVDGEVVCEGQMTFALGDPAA